MFVIKRNGTKEKMQFDKISRRLENLMWDLDDSSIDPAEVTQKVSRQLPKEIDTSAIDVLAAETCATMVRYDPRYDTLAARIVLSNLQKLSPETFSEAMEIMHQNTWTPVMTGFDDTKGFMSPEFMQIVRKHAKEIDQSIDHSRDYLYNDYSSAMLFFDKYSHRVAGRPVETPQYATMRIAISVDCMSSDSDSGNLQLALKAYENMSNHLYTHATPTIYNAGTKSNQLSSCFLLQMTEDSIEGIFETLKRCAIISKGAGGIGLAVHKIRPKGSIIHSVGMPSDGLVPMLRCFNSTARYVDQGKRRKGAFAVFFEPWHPDVYDLLEIRKNTGSAEMRCRDLFTALWIPDLFMKRVEQNLDWSLLDPNECPGLAETYGTEFEQLYESYEKSGKAVKVIKARDLWFAILNAQQETGTPYMLYKDACNAKSNQQNLGTIQCSNLCTEIVQYTSPDEVAVCNLASVSLPHFVRDVPQDSKDTKDTKDTKDSKGTQDSKDTKDSSPKAWFDFAAFHVVCQEATRRLDRIIGQNRYPIPESAISNMRHRPIGLGVQGLQNVFFKMHIPFTSPQARQINKEIFATMYHACLTASCHLAQELGAYSTFRGSPASTGKLQFDLWGETPLESAGPLIFDWDGLKSQIVSYGLRNSLLIAPMPTASTSTLLGNVECIEPQSYNVYLRRLSSGEYILLNKSLYSVLKSRGLWNQDLMIKILINSGSVQGIDDIPTDIQEVYKTVWEISVKDLIDMAADRGIYVCQSQSFNVHLKKPTHSQMSTMHFYGWKKGLKTGMYYLRREAETEAIKFTVDEEQRKQPEISGDICILGESGECLSCSS